MSKDKKTVFITGGAGYVGSMLANVLTGREDIEKVILLDKETKPETVPRSEKITFLCKNVLDDWRDRVARFRPDVVVHAAWQIREMYWERDKQYRWNIEGAKKVFSFAFNQRSVDQLIHFSTVAAYGADASNKRSHRFTESDNLRKSGYSYADEKLQSERILRQMHEAHSDSSQAGTEVAVLRPASITGPWGRGIRDKFGLQAALSGQLDASKSFWYWLIDRLLFFTPVTKKWARQFVHEDDVINVVLTLISQGLPDDFGTYNLAPPGPVVTGEDMAEVVGKPAATISPQLIRFVFFWVRHLSLGKIPTSAGSWKTYSYPIIVDGSKVTKDLGYEYDYDAHGAFTDNSGRFTGRTKSA
ncbi:MAG: hypothetical protein BRC25_00040 [Parcubacteria group bacterium SW_6_46_9]|nr:MAG: hypothetical protein BRC25_00040 [Parcubacteria group bacterium SW_6_46_9]